MATTGQDIATDTSTPTPTIADTSPPTLNAATKPANDKVTTSPDVGATPASALNPFEDASPDDDGPILKTSNAVSSEHREPTTRDASLSSSGPPDFVDDQPTPSLPQRPTPQIEEAHADPRIAALQAMFPTFDDLVLQSVLESVNWDQDRAIDMLLGMSDPEYKPETRPNPPPTRSQTDLDEEFARQLMLEDQRQQQAAWQASHPAPPGGGRRSSAQPAYQMNPQLPQQQVGPAQGGQIASDLQEQFNKVAEVGKKTFNNIFSKVKAKIQEFDAPARSDQSSTQPTWGAPSSQAPPQSQYGNEIYLGSQQPTSQPIHPAQQPAYYDPNPQRSPSISPQPSPIPAASPPPAAIANPWSSSSTAAQPTQTTSMESTSRASTGLPSGGSVPIDGNKLGLLPKRPVSLLRPDSGGTPSQIQRKDSEDDDLEYVENPFEEGNRK